MSLIIRISADNVTSTPVKKEKKKEEEKKEVVTDPVQPYSACLSRFVRRN